MDRAWDWVIAVGIAVIMLVTGLLSTGVLAGGLSSAGWEAVGYPLLAVGGLALGERQRAPVAVLIITGVCAVGYWAAGFDAFAVAYLIAVYTAMRAGRWVATTVVSATVLISLPLAALASGTHGAGEAFSRSRGVLELAWLIAAAAAGEALRQAEQRADEAVRTREAIARRRADEERLHIARELHDSLTHQISVIKVQSEAAVHVAQRRGEPVPEALLAIRDAGRAATRDLRATLEALREDAYIPPHGIEQITQLVEQAENAGIRTTLTMEGERVDVPFAIDRTAYRIVQEALTNVARHASAAAATVHINYRPDALAIRVDDDGATTPQSEPDFASVFAQRSAPGSELGSVSGSGLSSRPERELSSPPGAELASAKPAPASTPDSVPEAGAGSMPQQGDPRRDADRVSPGIGLLGMRERVTALGGSIRAGPRPGGGFTVDVELPWDRAG